MYVEVSWRIRNLDCLVSLLLILGYSDAEVVVFSQYYTSFFLESTNLYEIFLIDTLREVLCILEYYE